MHLFRELMGYCVTMINSSGYYSLALQHTPSTSYIILNFWSVNLFDRVCLGSKPRGMFLLHTLLNFISSFVSLFDTYPKCVAISNVGKKLGDCLSSCLPGKQQPANVRTFSPDELEQCTSIPTAQIIEQHDYRTILEFLLMKLRTALDRDWLKKLPVRHEVDIASFILSNRLKLSFLFFLFSF